MIALHLIGFAALAIVGWLMLELLRRLYESKRISEQSITVDAMWLLFGIVNSIGLVFEGYRWFASGFVAFAIYKLIGVVLFRLFGVSRRAQKKGHRLLLLRVFALGKRSEQLFDTLGKSWRTVGSIQMIAGPDLATTTIEPHEFLDFVSGKLDRRFIDTGRTLDLRIDQMDLAPDREGQFRVTEFFCHDDTWKMTLARLADDSDTVLMDLRGFSQANAGCVFEIHEIFNAVPLARAVFAIDKSTDQSFMRETMEQAWRQVKDRSPNRRLETAQVELVRLGDADGMQDLIVCPMQRRDRRCNRAAALTSRKNPARLLGRSFSMPVMPEGLVVIALKFFGNKVFFELDDLFRRQDRILGARHHAVFRRLGFLVPLVEHHRAAFLDLLQHFPGRLQTVGGG